MQVMMVSEWEGYMRLAYQYAGQRSDDPRTQTGAVIVNKNGLVIGWGTNRIPPGVAVLDERLTSEQKPNYIGHAERNAVANAARLGNRTEGAVMVAYWAACAVCAQAIIEAGIEQLVVHKQVMEMSTERWKDSIAVAMTMLDEAKIEVVYFDKKLGVKTLFDGKVIEV